MIFNDPNEIKYILDYIPLPMIYIKTLKFNFKMSIVNAKSIKYIINIGIRFMIIIHIKFIVNFMIYYCLGI